MTDHAPAETSERPELLRGDAPGDARLRRLLDSVLAFVGVLSTDGVLLEANEPAVAAAGVPREELIGRPFWDCYWWSFDPATQDRLRDAVARAAEGERIRYDAEIRVVGDGRLWIDFQIVPVLGADGRVTELIPSGVDITERKLAEAHRELLVRELSHRVKNTLATVQAMASQTLRTASSPAAFRDAFGARLRAIAASHDLLVEADHSAVDLAELVRHQVGPYANDDGGTLVLEGGPLELPGDVAHAMGLVLHELAGNASKYGALSTAGTVRVSWSRDGDGRLRLRWTERGGPPVAPPERRGFGTRLIEQTLSTEGGGPRFDYAPEGLTVEMTAALE